MGAWIVVIIVLSLMGSVFWIMPSTRDRQRMHLRKMATQKGLKDRMPDKALKERLIRYEDEILGSTIYENLNFSHQKVSFSGALLIVKAQGSEWRFIDEQVPMGVKSEVVLEAVGHLPNNCEVVMLTSGSSLVFWREVGEERDVDSIQSALDKINKSMS